VTGGTRGLGFGLVRAFLALGCHVTFCGREQGSVDEALARLRAELGAAAPVDGLTCDVSASDQVGALWAQAAARAPVDVWVNNAGRNAAPRPFWELELASVRAIVDTNIAGVVNGSWVALRGMIAQGHGAIYNLEGMGSDGSRWPGLAPYGASKLAVAYLSRALAVEARATKVLVATVEPGIVITSMLASVYADPTRFGPFARWIDGLAQPVDAVAPALARKMLANTRSGVRLRPFNAAVLWLQLLAAPFRARKLTSFPDR
jgi:NAD(P)-dependent dehydrogenase (short-subunit alcohol dehydrogenase family)